MGWVRRACEPRHTCEPPMRNCQFADGRIGDLWRCDTCEKLWRIGRACDLCEYYGTHNYGQCTIGTAWRPATAWQRFRHWLWHSPSTE